ncbi:MAG: XRE family transcriptional regulator [Xanthomonadales bacterium]|nr:XRE family transcriptional regulator [Xanthomonadales bacterium]
MTARKFINVWDALEGDASEAANLKLRSTLMMKIAEYVEENGLTQSQAAINLGTTQPRLNDVLRGRIDKCTVDRLVNMLTQVGYRVDLQIFQAA